jgi:hypothetical protein
VRLSLSDYLYTTVFISNSHGHGFAHNTKWSRVIGLSLLPELIPDGIFLILASTRGLTPCTRRMSPLPPYGMLVDERPGARSCAGECQVSSLGSCLGYEALWEEDWVFTLAEMRVIISTGLSTVQNTCIRIVHLSSHVMWSSHEPQACNGVCVVPRRCAVQPDIRP